jgi:hypothetical protein
MTDEIRPFALKFRLLSFPFRFDGFVSTRKMSSMAILQQSRSRIIRNERKGRMLPLSETS